MKSHRISIQRLMNEYAYADCDWLSILLSTNHSCATCVVVTGNKKFSEKMYYRSKRMIWNLYYRIQDKFIYSTHTDTHQLMSRLLALSGPGLSFTDLAKLKLSWTESWLYLKQLQCLLRRALKEFIDGASTTASGSLFQELVILPVKKFIRIMWCWIICPFLACIGGLCLVFDLSNFIYFASTI